MFEGNCTASCAGVVGGAVAEPVADDVGGGVGAPGTSTVPPPGFPVSSTGWSAARAAFRALAADDCGTTRFGLLGSATVGYCRNTMFESPTFFSASAISTSAVGLVRVSDSVTFCTAALARE